ncbi:MAG: dihydropteroate synthase [Chitinophagaceae bacterium]|nr:dihydropteroate synthase [Chitinophagaceae bacterium]
MAKNNSNHRIFTLNCKGRLIVIDSPLVMGIINITPDSFYKGSRFSHQTLILKQVEKMLRDGADMIDIGGQSTRPGSERVEVDQELLRVMPAMESVIQEFPNAIFSIDTFYSRVASEAVAAGASIVNDTSGGGIDRDMLQVVAALETPYICMHAQGTPDTMQQKPFYENLTGEILDFFIQKTEACRLAGIKDIIIDPGFGFGKTIRHNFELLQTLAVFKMLDKPLLIGISRKSTIYKTLNITSDEALNGTTVLNTIGLLNGADILRVHDVKEARETILLYREYIR